jgi:hypothetical protein
LPLDPDAASRMSQPIADRQSDAEYEYEHEYEYDSDSGRSSC